MKGITISITLPKPLEDKLNKEAREKGLSRSRHIVNLLLELEASNSPDILLPNDCINLDRKKLWCSEYNITCKANKTSAKTCEEYVKETI